MHAAGTQRVGVQRVSPMMLALLQGERLPQKTEQDHQEGLRMMTALETQTLVWLCLWQLGPAYDMTAEPMCTISRRRCKEPFP